MVNKASRAKIRENKHRRLRHHLNGTATTPRLAVFRSNKHMYAQIIDDTVGNQGIIYIIDRYLDLCSIIYTEIIGFGCFNLG